MRTPRFLILAVVVSALSGLRAQNPADGRVIDSDTGAGIAGAQVVLFTHQEARYHAVTDDSGALRFPPVEPGEYRATIEKSGYFVIPDGVIKVDGTTTPNLLFKLSRGTPGKASLSGQVLDPDGAPMPGARVDLIRGPAEYVSLTTGADGRFVFEKLTPGGYKLRAVPPPAYRGKAVATYFPSSFEESTAHRIVVTDKAEIDGFRLAAATVFRVQGIVRDNSGNPVEGAVVRRMASISQPVHVVASFVPNFLALGQGPGTGMEEEAFTTGKDGKFEFRSVRAGEWRIVATGPESVDARTGFDAAPSGISSIRVSSDVEDVEVRVKAPATLSGRTWWAINQCAYLSPGPCGPVDARFGPPGVVEPIWIQAADGQSSSLGLAISQTDGTFQWKQVPSGRFLPFRLPGIAPQGLPTDAHLVPYGVLPVKLARTPGRQPAEPLDLEQGSVPEMDGLAFFDADGTKPLLPEGRRLRLDSRSIRGHVEGGGTETSVVVLSQNAGVYSGQLVNCDSNGDFVAQNLWGGEYYVAAFHGVDFAALRDPEILHLVIDRGQKIVLAAADASATVRLSELPWF